MELYVRVIKTSFFTLSPCDGLQGPVAQSAGLPENKPKILAFWGYLWIILCSISVLCSFLVYLISLSFLLLLCMYFCHVLAVFLSEQIQSINHSNQEHWANPSLINVLGSLRCITQHTGPSALHSIQRTKK